MSEVDIQPVKRRAVFFIGGFDPKSALGFYSKLFRETERFKALWSVDVSSNDMEAVSRDVTRVDYVTNGDGWQCETQFNFLTIDDVVLQDFAQPFIVRFFRYFVTFWDYVLTGTAFKFFRHAWRFGIYFMYPATMILFALLIGIFAYSLVANSSMQSGDVIAPFVLAAVFFGTIVSLGGKFHVLHLMDLWSFSRDFLRGKRNDIGEKLDRLADMVAETAESGEFDEILLIGHSTGGALILDVAGRAHERHTKFKDVSENVSVLTVGSTALKIGLHPVGGSFITRLSNMLLQTKVSWVEYQCLTDIINFHRTDPGLLMELPRGPIIRDIKIKHMVGDDVYERMKRNFFRVHYQFVFGNTRPYHYDFPGICFGPTSLLDRAQFMPTMTKSLQIPVTESSIS